MLKKIEAIVRPTRFEAVRQVLASLGVKGITVSQVHSEVLGKPQKVVYRLQEYSVDLEPRLKVEIVVGARDADEIIDAVLDAARTGDIDDGQIFVSEISEAIRVCNSQRNEAAV